MQAFNPFIQGIGNARLSLIIGLMDGVVARIGLFLLFEQVLHMGMFGVLLGYTLATFWRLEKAQAAGLMQVMLE